MRFGLTFEIRQFPQQPQPWRELWEDALWLFKQAEELGFDSLFVQEHFFTPDGYGPSIPVFLTALSERTSDVRLGSYISILPLHHPGRLAQEMAVLDQLSGGRLEVGVGAGHRAAEFKAMGISTKTRPSRIEESIAFMRTAWTGEPFTFEGKYFPVENLQIKPEPLQEPHPPLWLAATTPAPAERAGRLGLNLHAAAADPAVFDAYRTALAAHGHDPAEMRVSVIRAVTVTDEDPELVWDRNSENYFFRWDYYRQIREEFGDPQLRVSVAPPDPNTYRANELIGTASDVLPELKELLQVSGATDLILNGPPPGVDIRTEGYELVRRYAEDVIPALRDWASAREAPR